jgi:uncharacterized membrane protein (UPF0136 family)
MSPIVAQITLGVYAALLAVGGIIGFVKAKSRPSLIAGVGSGLVAAGLLGWSFVNPTTPLQLALLLAAGLAALFGHRYSKSRKFMPSGLLLAISLGVGLLLSAYFLGIRR